MRKRKHRKNERAKPAVPERSSHADRVLFISVCAAIGFETLFFCTGIGNAFIVPKLVAILLGAAVLVPQICFRLTMDFPHDRADSSLHLSDSRFSL